MVFSTDDPVVEVNKMNPPARTMITTNTFKDQQQQNQPPADHTSRRVGTNNPAFSRLPIADKHLLIAKHMQSQFAEKI